MGAGHIVKSTAILSRTDLIVKTDNAITDIPPTPPYSPNSLFPNAASTHRLMNSPHTSAYRLRPYVATMFKNILRLGDIRRKLRVMSWELRVMSWEL